LKINYKALDLIYISSIPIALKLLQSQIRQEQLTLRMAEQKLSAELKLLRNQLQPHFLFNTLNNLYGMVLTQDAKASDVVLRLSDMMSYMLYECDGPLVPLEKEIKNLENYIELEKVRYGDRLSVSLETGGDIQDKMLPPLLFIPFVENAFKHGAGKSTQASWIRINLWVVGNQLQWIMENSLENGTVTDEHPQVHSGIGLANVRKRLELIFPEKYSLDIKCEETFLVQLKIDLENEMSNR
ncbi:MAG: histidine kinase, partial [Bacteroidota bacterium]